MTMWTERITREAPVTVQLLQQAEQLFLGPTADLTLNPVVQDVFAAMRVAGLILLAFCTVISLAELAESSITGTGGGLVGWFKRFFVSVLMTFGGLQFYGLWIRLFNAMLVVFRDYLDRHWTNTEDLGAFYLRMIAQIVMGHGLLAITLAVLTLLILLVLWFLVGGVRQAELVLSMVIAPLVWPLYLVPSVEDIPKTALRGFLGLNALLLLTVAMVRVAIRMAITTGEMANIWQLVPALSMLIMTVFLPATVKRIVGQGHSGVGALVTAVQLAAGLKFLSMGVGGGAAAASAPPASSSMPQAPGGASAYPVASVAPAGMAPVGASGGAQPQQVRVATPSALPAGSTAAPPMALEAPPSASDTCIDLGESAPGSGRFDQVIAMRRYRQGLMSYQPRREQADDDPGGDR